MNLTEYYKKLPDANTKGWFRARVKERFLVSENRAAHYVSDWRQVPVIKRKVIASIIPGRSAQELFPVKTKKITLP